MKIKNILSLVLCFITTAGRSSAKITDHAMGISALATWFLHVGYETNYAWGKAAADFAAEQKKSSENMADVIEELTLIDFITSPQLIKKNIRWKRLVTSGILTGAIALSENHSKNKRNKPNTPEPDTSSTNNPRATTHQTDQPIFIPDPEEEQAPTPSIEELSRALPDETKTMKSAGDQLYNLYAAGTLANENLSIVEHRQKIAKSKHFQAAARLSQHAALNLLESRYRLVNNMPQRKDKENSALTAPGIFHTLQHIATTIAVKTMESREKWNLLPVAQPKQGADQTEVETYETFKAAFMTEFYENLNTIVRCMCQGNSYAAALTFVFEDN